MDFYEMVGQVLELLQRQGRVSYRALKRQFGLDDDYIEDLKEELIYAQRLATDEDDRILVWTGETEPKPEPASITPARQEVSQQAQPAEAEPPPPEPPTPDAERRQLTVMFSDLVDSTTLSGQLDPEDYREVLRAYQSTCSEVIQRFGGYIAQHLGDALLVYFGFPTAHEDEGQRAVRTGLGMLETMKALNTRLEQEKGIRLAIRVGIHTGLTVISDVGSGQKHELLALGEAPNIASRIQGLSEPNSIAISAATFRLVEGYFDCDDLGFHTLKGVAEPQQVYRVLQESGVQSRLEIATARGLTPLVGREQEVGLLLERWAQVKDGQGQIVLLSGEGGIGKSRLVQVLKDHLADEPHTRWECRSSPYYQNTALYPITDLFQRSLQWQPEDAPDEKLAKLERTLSQYRLPLEESVPLFAALLSIPLPEDRYPPLNWTPQRQRQKTLESILEILLEQAERQPVLFIIEDLHWLDPTTLEFLDLVIDQTPTASLCTLFTCRPAFQPTWSHRSYLTEATVNRLSRNQIARMAEQVAGGKHLPTEVVQHIVEKTDGVPLFVEEMVKAVLESGLLQEVNGQYELAGSLTVLTIPATLQDSLMARLDRLVTAKAVAQYASVIGRQFSYQLLQAVSQLDERMLQHELKRLVDAELLYQRGLPPQATYTFKHALIQDTAYESLLRSTRQQYHARIAAVLEHQFPETAETQLELLAHHYTQAGLHGQAADYWQQAGQRASERSAYVEAIAHLQHGLEILQTLPETAARAQQELSLHLALAAALTATEGYAAPEVGQAYTRARHLCQQIGETPQLFVVLAGLRLFYLNRAERQKARELAEQLLRQAQRQQDAALLQKAHFALGHSLWSLGELASTRAHLEQSMACYTPQPLSSPASRDLAGTQIGCLGLAAEILWRLGYPEQARTRLQESLSLAHELSHPFTLSFPLVCAARLYRLCREVQAAKTWAEALIAHASEQGFPYWLAWGTMLRGWALAVQGQGEEGIAQIRQGQVALQAMGGESGVIISLLMLAEAYERAGQPEEGLCLLAEALAHVNQQERGYEEAELHQLKGVLLLSLSPNHRTEAEACFHQALSVARSQQAKSLELRAATSLARLWQSRGKRQEAYDLLAPVYGWFTEGFDTTDLKNARALLDVLA